MFKKLTTLSLCSLALLTASHAHADSPLENAKKAVADAKALITNAEQEVTNANNITVDTNTKTEKEEKRKIKN